MKERLAAVITKHQAWRSWAETDEGWYCGGCQRRYPNHLFDEHIAVQVMKELGLTRHNEGFAAPNATEFWHCWATPWELTCICTSQDWDVWTAGNLDCPIHNPTWRESR